MNDPAFMEDSQLPPSPSRLPMPGDFNIFPAAAAAPPSASSAAAAVVELMNIASGTPPRLRYKSPPPRRTGCPSSPSRSARSRSGKRLREDISEYDDGMSNASDRDRFGHPASSAPSVEPSASAAAIAEDESWVADEEADDDEAFEYPDGPSEPDELLDWCRQDILFLESRLHVDWQSACSCFTIDPVPAEAEQGHHKQLVFSTWFSGIGTAEMAFVMSKHYLQKKVGKVLDFKVYSSGDIDDMCQKILNAHTGELKPWHVFGSILDRLPVYKLRKIEELQKKKLEQFRKDARSHAWSKSLKVRNFNRCCQEFVDDALEVLEDNTHGDRDILASNIAFCSKHHKGCCIGPAGPDMNYENLFWVEVAGLICTPWSTAGNQLMWLDPKALPTLVYLWSLRYLRVHVVIAECTPRLDLQAVRRILGTGFSLENVVFCISGLGYPAHRRRVYIRITRTRSTTIRLPFTLNVMKKIFFREVVGVPEKLFFVAPSADVSDYMNTLAHSRGIPPHPRGKTYMCRHVLPIQMLQRLEAFETQWDKHRIQKIHDGAPVDNDAKYLAHISQNLSHSAKTETWVPTLLRNSVVWSERRQRTMIPQEHFLVQGFPMYQYHHEAFAINPAKFLFTSIHDMDDIIPAPERPPAHLRLTNSDIRQLTGNAMALPTVGSVLLLTLAGVVPL